MCVALPLRENRAQLSAAELCAHLASEDPAKNFNAFSKNFNGFSKNFKAFSMIIYASVCVFYGFPCLVVFFSCDCIDDLMYLCDF